VHYRLACTQNSTPVGAPPPPPQPNSTAWLVGDEPGYNNMALEFLQGYAFTWPGRLPLYPTLLAGLHWLTFSSYHEIRSYNAHRRPW
jgi:hypothetical protein